MELFPVMEEGPSGLISGVTGGLGPGGNGSHAARPSGSWDQSIRKPSEQHPRKGRAFDSTRPDDESALSLGEGERLPRGPTGGVNSGRGPHPWRGWTPQFPWPPFLLSAAGSTMLFSPAAGA